MKKQNLSEIENNIEDYRVKIEFSKKDAFIYNCIIYSNYGKDFVQYMPEINASGVIDFTYELIFRTLFLIRTKSYAGISEEEVQQITELLYNALE